MGFRRIVLGTAAMSSVSMFRLVAQFFVVPILSRLLSPVDYGIVAMAMPFVLFTMNFTDAGVGQSLVRTTQREQDVWSTSFWLTILSGTGLALVIAGLSPLAAMFFREPQLQPIVMALALVIIPQAGATIPEASLRQDHRFALIAMTEIAAVLAGIATAILVAVNGGGAWALVGQQMVLYSSRFLLTFGFSSFRPKITFNLSRIRDHLAFGRDVLSAKFIWFLTQAMDGVIIGRVLGAVTLGYYTMAASFVRLPVQLITGPLQYVIYAHIAPIKDNKPVLRQIFMFFTRALAIVIFPGMGMVAAAYHPVFKLFLSEKWLHSGSIFMLATPAAALQCVTALRGTLMLALGRTKVQLRSSIEFMCLLGVFLLVSVHFGITWLVIGYSCAVFLYFPRSLNLILPQIGLPLWTYARVLFFPAAVACGVIALYYGLNQLFVLGDWQQLFLGGALGVVGIAVSGLGQRKVLLSEIAVLRAHWSSPGGQ